MRTMRFGMLALAAVALVGFAGNAYAFHSGGVAECGGCHSMHSPDPDGTFLLVGADQSSACLTCHENAADTGPSSYHVSTAPGSLGAGQAPLQRGPGGDFGWIKKDYTFTVRGTTSTEDGDTHGHNIIAGDFGYAVDGTNGAAPGGSFPSAQLACNSCHAPHGQYRRLQGNVISKSGGPIKASGSYPAATNEPDATNAVGVYRLLAGPAGGCSPSLRTCSGAFRTRMTAARRRRAGPSFSRRSRPTSSRSTISQWCTRTTPWVIETMGLILNERYNAKRLTLITTNRLDSPPPGEESLADRIGERLASRLSEMCWPVRMDGEDYRRKIKSASFFA